ncbi:bacteriocin-like protein [Mucilaginibacter segetis]|uniref:Bacteriocin-type signal sequence-containing protein n=1 Tax=Mucilaginibacter segetis TaxID=2793071 RepID=A0A934PU09_9SPHI|nr:hypothetical protein [Mucilaginibacter segetis]MBK0379576.1 hypothetical protein [Mucilaginibacter segetis]
MKNLKQLSRSEMKKINGGLPPVCNPDNSCTVEYLGALLFANCSTTINGGCICSRDFNGTIIYGDTTYCSSPVS